MAPEDNPMQNEPPGSFGIEAAVRGLREHLDQQFHTLREYLSQQHGGTTARLNRLEKVVKQMPTRAEFDAAKTALMQAITDETAQVTKAIQDLRDQLAAGNPITDQDLVDLQTATAGVSNVDPDQVAPTP